MRKSAESGSFPVGMCGRYAFALSPGDLENLTGSVPEAFPAACYNRAPGVPVDALEGDGEWSRPAWGAEAIVGGGKKRLVINARSETVAEKRMFADSFQRKRCVLPATGFFEWRRRGRASQPFFFPAQDGGGLLFGGVLVVSGEDRRVVVLTREAGEWMAEVHHRVPVLIRPDRLEAWLESGTPGREALEKAAFADEGAVLSRYPVCRRVNRVAEDDPGLLAPVEEEVFPEQQDLFK